MFQSKGSVLLCIGVVLVVGGLQAPGHQPNKFPAEVANALQKVTAELRKKGSPQPRVHWLGEKSLETTFPNHHFFSCVVAAVSCCRPTTPKDEVIKRVSCFAIWEHTELKHPRNSQTLPQIKGPTIWRKVGYEVRPWRFSLLEQALPSSHPR